ncbi:TPA: hypothetical protein DCZ36_02180 [Candidatus Gracilibacteria bacterium]|nr:hypothetical protein [Candidatus Gracilibacteria bacterium]
MKKNPILISIIFLSSFLLISCSDEEKDDDIYREDTFERGDTKDLNSNIWENQKPSRKSDTKTRAS